MFGEILQFDNPRWKQCQWHFHVFKPIQWHGEVEIFNIETHVFSAFHAKNAIPHQFRCGKICRSCGLFSRIMNEISPGCYTNYEWVFLLQTEINNDTSICDCLSFGDEFHFIVSHDKNRINAFLSRLIAALCHTTKIFAECRLPHLRCCRVVHKAFVAINSFARGWMYHQHCNLCEIQT